MMFLMRKNLFTGDRRKTDYLNPYVFLKGDTPRQ